MCLVTQLSGQGCYLVEYDNVLRDTEYIPATISSKQADLNLPGKNETFKVQNDAVRIWLSGIKPENWIWYTSIGNP